jgi:hypothetical protein
VILTALSDKGSILKLALQRAKLLFKKIIFIDDDLRNLQSVEKICHEMGIDFQGFQYTAVNLVPLPALDKEKEVLRFKILETEHKWLSDEEMNINISAIRWIPASFYRHQPGQHQGYVQQYL